MSRSQTPHTCFVPICKNTKIHKANKLFIVVPRNRERRIKWFEAVHDSKERLHVPWCTLYCCEDHFNLEEDAANWIAYKAGARRLTIKEHVVPHKFVFSPPPPGYEEFTQFPLSFREERCKYNGSSERNKKVKQEKCFVPICKNYRIMDLKEKQVKIFLTVPNKDETRRKWYEAVHDPTTPFFLIYTPLVCCEDHFNLEEDAANWIAYKSGATRLRIKEHVVPHKFIFSPPPPGYEEFTQVPISFREEKWTFNGSSEGNKKVKQDKCFVPICKNYRIMNLKKKQVKIFLTVPNKGERRRKWYEAVRDPTKPFFLISTPLVCCEDHFNLEEDAENWIAYKTMDLRLKIKPHVVPHKFILNPPPPGYEKVTQFPLKMRKKKWKLQESLEESQSEYYKALKKKTVPVDCQVLKTEYQECEEFEDEVLFKGVEVADDGVVAQRIEIEEEKVKIKTEEIEIEEMELNEAIIKTENTLSESGGCEEIIKKEDTEAFEFIDIAEVM